MAKENLPLLVGNWKLNPGDVKEAQKLGKAIIKQVASVRGIAVVVCPSCLHLAPIKLDYSGKKIGFGAQDVSVNDTGSHTGDVAAKQLKNLGISHVIVGHSERRHSASQFDHAESNQLVAKKAQTVVDHGMSPIICIGEDSRDISGDYLRTIEEQLVASLDGINSKNFNQIIIAYEPVWAIGGQSNSAITSHDLYEMMLYIKKVAGKVWGQSSANKLTILYGGSVKPDNAYDLALNGNMDGFLVGGASLSADSFVSIAKEMRRALHDKS